MHRQAFNDDALGKSQVYEWFSRFKSGNMSTEDMPRPGRPSTGRNDENSGKIKRAIDEDRRKTIDQLSEETNISWSTVQRILTEGLHMRRVAAKFVPPLLRDDERENCVNVCRDLKSPG
jgi:transposase